MARMNEVLIGLGFCAQDDISTANTASGIKRIRKVNPEIAALTLATEDDANEIGSGNEFATNVFRTNWNFGVSITKYCTSEFMAWLMAMSLGGGAGKSGTTPNYTYTNVPLVPVTDGLELPYFSYLEQIRPGASALLDRIAIGCAVNDWTLTIRKGPGRASAQVTVNIVGSGKHDAASGITMPSELAEHLLQSASLACTINSVDYVAAKSIRELTLSWNNNIDLDDGFYPGSGFQTAGDGTSGAVRGRLQIGPQRSLALDYVCDFDAGATEETKLLAGTEGTAVLSLTYDTNNSWQATIQRVQFGAVQPDQDNGTLVQRVSCRNLWHSSNGLITTVSKCTVDKIGEAES